MFWFFQKKPSLHGRIVLAIIYFSAIFSSEAKLQFRIKGGHKSRRQDINQSQRFRPYHFIDFRGGDVSSQPPKLLGNQDKDAIKSKIKMDDPFPHLPVLVTTSIGSSFLDKKKRFILRDNMTVAELKAEVQKKFPGCPPVALQNIYFGLKRLGDDECIASVSPARPLPLMLDMLSGTSAYNRTFAVSQALEAYAALQTHQAYISSKIQQYFAYSDSSEQKVTKLIDGIDYNVNSFSKDKVVKVGEDKGKDGGIEAGVVIGVNINCGVLESLTYRRTFSGLLDRLHRDHTESIAMAIKVESKPEIASPDTAPWRSGQQKFFPLKQEIAKTFDLNMRCMKNFTYYSLLLVIFSQYGTRSYESSFLILCMVPILWLMKLRQLRHLSHLFVNLSLSVFRKGSFLLPLLPAPYQALAHSSDNWPCQP